MRRWRRSASGLRRSPGSATAWSWLGGNSTSREYIARAAARVHIGLRYRLAAEEWNAARLRAWTAQDTAIKDYTRVVTSCYVSHMRPIRTEVRYMDGGNPGFPVVPNCGVLPDE